MNMQPITDRFTPPGDSAFQQMPPTLPADHGEWDAHPPATSQHHSHDTGTRQAQFQEATCPICHPSGFRLNDGPTTTAAREAWQEAHFIVANLAQDFILLYGPRVAALLPDAASDTDTLQIALYDRFKKQEAYLLTLFSKTSA